MCCFLSFGKTLRDNYFLSPPFVCLSRTFQLRLRVNHGLFSPDFVASAVDKHGRTERRKIDPSRFYHGVIDGNETFDRLKIRSLEGRILRNKFGLDFRAHIKVTVIDKNKQISRHILRFIEKHFRQEPPPPPPFRRCLSTFSLPWCKKSKWPKTQIKGVSCLNHY